MHLQRIEYLVGLCLISALPSCVAASDDPGEDLDTASTEQAVSWTHLSWHKCTSLRCDVALDDPATSTCFLAGITGKLASGSPQDPAGANIVNNGSYWGLHILNPNYEDVSVMTACIANTANRVEASWHTGTAATEIANGTANRRCFLSGVYSYGATGFSTYASSVEVWRDGNSHFIGGSMPAGSNDTIFARCVDTTTREGSWEYGNNSANSAGGNLAYNPATGGVVCGLTAIGGRLTVTDPSRGVWIDYDSATRYWNWTFTPYTNARAFCVK
jgi:hypothetical protein